MPFVKNRLFLFLSLFLFFIFALLPLKGSSAKTINLGATGDLISVPGQMKIVPFTGTGNRCLYVDSNNNISAKTVDCGTATGGDNLGDHNATQSIKLNSYWLSGDGGSEGVGVDATGQVGVGINTNLASKLHVYDATSGPIITLSGLSTNYRGLTVKDTAGAEQWFYGPNNSNNFTLRRSGTTDYLSVNASNGYVGIGAVSPVADLHIGSGSLGYITRTRMIIQPPNHTGGPWKIDARDDASKAYLDIHYGSGVGMTLNSDGNFGVGTSSPTSRLHIVGDSYLNGNATATGYLSITGASNTSGNLRFSSPNPYISASSYILMPGGLYVSGGTLYANNQAQLRGGIRNDNGPYLELTGGTSTVTYINGKLGVGTSAPGAKTQINAVVSNEALRLISASDWSPLNIRDSTNASDIFRVDQTGSLAVGSIPWARLSSFPSACTAGQYVTAVGSTLSCASPSAGADVYWTGTSTNLVAATGRASLGLGALATLSAVGSTEITDGAIVNGDINASAAIADSKIQSGAYFITAAGTSGQIWTSDGVGAGAWAAPGASTDIYWTGTATNLVAATGRTSLGLGALATLSTVGSTEITNSAIVDADINASAAIADSKIQSGAYFITSAGTSGQVWSSDGIGAGAWTTTELHNAMDVSIAIGSTPNASGASIGGAGGQILTLQPANGSFGGVVTTASQTFAGAKSFSNNVGVGGALAVTGEIGGSTDIYAAGYLKASNLINCTNKLTSNAAGQVICSAATSTQVLGTLSNTITLSGGGGSITAPYATTAGALSSNPTNCSAGYYALGVDANGAAEGCTSAAGSLPSGTASQTLRYVTGTGWTANSVLLNDGTNVGVGIAPTYKFQVNGDSAATAFVYSSDRSLKKNILPLNDPLAKILQLRGVSFTWRQNNKASIGLIAQEVEKVFPELVTGKEGAKGVQYGNLVAPLIEAVREQQAQIEALESRLEYLEAK